MPEFSEQFRHDFDLLMRWRRDVRRFRTDPISEELLSRCLSTFQLAPSVGLSEPWRIVRVKSDAARAAALKNFEIQNQRALDGYSAEKASIYARLKLSGMQDSPVQLAIFCDESTEKGSGLGAGTMPEMRRYSVVSAITQFWLVTRSEGLGVGWVSIIDPQKLSQDLDVPKGWRLVAYLCVGWPVADEINPELEREGWETRAKSLPIISR